MRTLLAALPESTSLALVLVQHLAAGRESGLADILRGGCRLPVLRAENGMRIEGGHVYVIPEGVTPGFAEGAIRLHAKAADFRGRPIDALFISLASHSQTSACAVLLSGEGTDGLQGLREVAGGGGLTFVQDPHTAEHPSLPATAIAAGVADFVGSPAEIVETLLERSGRLDAAKRIGQEIPVEEREALDDLLGLLDRDAGMDFSGYKTGTVRRRVGRRVALSDAGSLTEYLDLVRGDPEELRALLGDMLINVTQFFRDPDVFEGLRTRVIPTILEGKRAGDSIRVWVPGCSTGEEVYSLLITLIETLDQVGSKPSVTVFGTDASEDVLKTARAGVYFESISAHVSPERLSRFFVATTEGYEVDRALREMCVFARQDVTMDTPFSRLDLISMRNLLIYMSAELQDRVMAVMHYALVPGGFLVLGTSETPETRSKLFEVYDKKRHIYRRGDVTPRLPSEVTGTIHIGREAFGTAAGLMEPVTPEFDAGVEADEVALERYAPPRVVVDAKGHVLHLSGDVSPYLHLPEGKATLDLTEIARPGMSLDLGEVLDSSAASGAPEHCECKFIGELGESRNVAIDVIPLPSPAGERFRLVAFREMPLPLASVAALPPGHEDLSRLQEDREQRLRREISAQRVRLRSLAEEKDAVNQALRAANEEVRSSNEELQSINEELETAKEELESSNEELTTVNDELRQRNIDLVLLNDALTNFVSSADVPILMLDRDLRVRRFTPQADRVIHIVPSDEGRLLQHLRPRFDMEGLEQRIREVVSGELDTYEREVRDDRGRWHLMRITPYRATAERETDGAVLSFFDIDELKRSLETIELRAHLGEVLNAIDTTLASALDFDIIMQQALDLGVLALDADSGIINLREGSDWVVRYQNGLGPAVVGLHSSDAGARAATLAEERREPVTTDLRGDVVLEEAPALSRDLRSVLAVPLIVNEAVIGCLMFYFKNEPRSLPDVEVDFARRLAASVSLALENARLLADEREAVRTAEALNKVNEILMSALTPGEVLTRLVGEVSRVAGADNCLVVEVHGETCIATHVRDSREDVVVGEPKTAEHYPGFALAAREGRPLLIEDSWNDPRTNKDVVVPNGLRAFQLLPLTVGGEVACVLGFAYDTPRTFDAEDHRFSERLCVAMSLALRNARLHEAERRRAALGTALAEVDASMHSTLESGEILQRALTSGAEALGADTAALSVYEDRSFRVTHAHGYERDIVGTVIPDELEKHSVLALKVGEPVAIEDCRNDPRAVPEHMAEYDTAAVLAIPLSVRGEITAVAHYNFAEPRAFTRPELEFAGRLASSLSLAIENARLYEAERGAAARLRLLAESARLLLSADTPEPVVQTISEQVMAFLDCQVFLNYLVEDGEERLRLNAYAGIPQEAARKIQHLDFSVAVRGCVVRDREGVVIEDVRHTPDEGVDLVKPFGIQACACYPLVCRGETIGVLSFGARDRTAFVDEELELMRVVADQAATAMARKKAEQALRASRRDLDRAQAVARVGSWRLDARRNRLDWSDETYRMFAIQPETPLTYETFLSFVHPEDREYVDGKWGAALRGEPYDIEHRIVVGDEIMWVRERAELEFDERGALLGGFGTVQDVTERKDAEAGIQRALAEVEADRERLRTIIDEMPVGVALHDESGAVLESNRALAKMLGGEPPKAHGLHGYGTQPAFRQSTEEPLPPEEWPTARVVRTGDAHEVFADLVRFDGGRIAARIRSLPLKNARGILWGILAFTEDVTEQAERERLERALNDIREEITATFEADEILSHLMRSGSEALGTDSAAVSMRGAGRWTVERVHYLPEESVGRSYADDKLGATETAARERRPVAVNDTTTHAGADARHARELGIGAMLIVPLIVQGGVAGAVSFHNETPTGFTRAQVDFATRMMSIVALALDNSHAYKRERTIADTLQDAVLAPLQPVRGISTAHLYRPASAVANVGGDFYDLFAIDHRHVGIVVGDVSGKGLDAARLTSLVRDGIRAYGYEHGDPAHVLRHVNTLVERSSPLDSFATVFFGVLDVVSGCLRYCSAGHPAAVWIGAEPPCYLPGPPSPILGAFADIAFVSGSARLARGDTLVLYTDGVTEARRDRELFGEERLLAALEALRSAPLEGLPEGLLAEVVSFSGGELTDDTVVLCVRWTGLETEDDQA